MTSTAPKLTIEHHDSTGLNGEREALLEVYAEVYADRLDDPFFSLQRYWGRVESYASRPGFALAVGKIDDSMIGYALGYTLPDGSGWWRGLRSSAAPDDLRETGTRTFALTEIMVRDRWRRRGYARQLHDALLEDRPEDRATLLVLPDNVPARAAYESWGWLKLGELQPFDDAPTYDAMIKIFR
jgi:ribosomal protein S18 acetylase RimI-like enzyme